MQQENIERRFQFDLELRYRKGQPATIAGYAAIFNSLSDVLTLDTGRTYREIIRPGAFAESLRAKDDVLARFEHRELLGRVSNGTLRLVEDQRGLRYEIDPPNTTDGRDVVALIRRGDIAASSFAFKVRPGGDTWRQEGATLIREVRSVVLVDVSPVSRPAYPATDVALRSFNHAIANQTHMQRMAMRLALAEAS